MCHVYARTGVPSQATDISVTLHAPPARPYEGAIGQAHLDAVRYVGRARQQLLERAVIGGPALVH